jgi:AcrR family transcriptional regulator
VSDGWERRQERTRSDVLSAAGSLIAESGVEGLTMRRLAERAGVAVATLYNQFGDRDGVLVAFVSAGLDGLERQVDAQSELGPIDTTRGLFDALDRTVRADEAVWRPVFALLKAGSGVAGMGAVGERVVAIIEQDLGKAAADGWFAVPVDVEALARHIFVTRMSRLERWAVGTIDWTIYESSSALGLELSLAAVLAEPRRSDALARSGVAAS